MPVHAYFFDDHGQSDWAAIGLAENPRVNVSADDPALGDVANWYRSQGGDMSSATPAFSAVRLFNSETPANEVFIVRASKAVLLWLLIDPQEIFRSERVHHGGMGGVVSFEHSHNGTAISTLPEPFADVHDEFTIPRGTARAYELKAGEVVQVIDVDGCLLYTSPSPRDGLLSRMPSSA